MNHPPTIKANERIYAIGDVHGRFDLFEALLEKIANDALARPQAPTTLIVLGDFIDRGPDAASMVRHLMRYSRSSSRFLVLKGNHEASMVGALRGDIGMMSAWLTYGGDATLRSWGVSDEVLLSGAPAHIAHEARQVVSSEVLEWLERLPISIRSGLSDLSSDGSPASPRLADSAAAKATSCGTRALAPYL